MFLQQEKLDLEKYRYQVATGAYEDDEDGVQRRRIKKSSYFSDEEESD